MTDVGHGTQLPRRPFAASCVYCGAPISVPEKTCFAHDDLPGLEADTLGGWSQADYQERTRV